ncbi:MAG: SURF1 family protein [Aestuariivita sp.]|nr:SURF1 family protein [Aestuariivita sp.]
MRKAVIFFFFGLSGTILLTGLGIWQLQRLNWKENLLQEIESKISGKPQPLPQQLERAKNRYLPVVVNGSFLPGELHVLVSIKRVGAGYRIIAPFQTSDGRRIMIDRGFVPVSEKNAERQMNTTKITGNLHWPNEIDRFIPDTDYASNIWFARDVDSMASELETLPVLLIARSLTDKGVTPVPVDMSGIPNNHFEYAMTWFSLAAIWGIMSVFAFRHRSIAIKG